MQARYAVRNNQRNFLKITLPTGATLWSASLAGKPVRPGQSPDGSVLLPLEKAHAGEDSPEFAVEIVYISRGTAWNDKGQFKLALPALDLPVSRTGLLVFHPPLFKVTSETGSFRAEVYADPLSAALNPPSAPPPPLPRLQPVRWPAPLWLEERLAPSRRTAKLSICLQRRGWSTIFVQPCKEGRPREFFPSKSTSKV